MECQNYFNIHKIKPSVNDPPLILRYNFEGVSVKFQRNFRQIKGLEQSLLLNKSVFPRFQQKLPVVSILNPKYNFHLSLSFFNGRN